MTIKQRIAENLKPILKELTGQDIEPNVSFNEDSDNGDYSTNVAMVVYGNQKSKIKNQKEFSSPMELAEEIAEKLKTENLKLNIFEKVEVVKPGFINFWISNDTLISSLTSLGSGAKVEAPLSGKKILVEFAHPNTHKAFHIGHLRNITIGESIVRLLEATGVQVVRGNYQGDVGMHIAKCLYSILQNSKFKIQNSKLSLEQKADFLGKAYAEGSKAYEEDEAAKKEIMQINKKIYAKDASIWEIYKTTRQWSLDYFDFIYKRLGTRFDRFYFESEIFQPGKENVLKGLEKGIFEKSDGAIIFPGKKFGLHDRVFITGEGNPTYEGKEMGLGPLQFKENSPDKIIHVVGPEQSGFFQVVFEALSQMFPETKGKEQHLAYGWVKLKHGKMSSRSGNVVLGEGIIDEAKKEILNILDKNRSDYTKEIQNEIAEQVAIAAVKYSFLKVSTQQEIAFDLEESVAFDGNSGPYIQYVFARTQSVLAKRATENLKLKTEKDLGFEIGNLKLEIEERELLRLLPKFDEVVIEAAERLAPNVVATYLFELAQAFNLFYQKHQILKATGASQDFRLFLTLKTGEVIKKGLSLLGIQAPSKM